MARVFERWGRLRRHRFSDRLPVPGRHDPPPESPQIAASPGTADRPPRPIHILKSGTASETHADVVRALGRLAVSDRQILVLTEWLHRSSEEAGRVLGIAPSSARARLHRARNRFRDVLGEGYAADRSVRSAERRKRSSRSFDGLEPTLRKAARRRNRRRLGATALGVGGGGRGHRTVARAPALARTGNAAGARAAAGHGLSIDSTTPIPAPATSRLGLGAGTGFGATTRRARCGSWTRLLAASQGHTQLGPPAGPFTLATGAGSVWAVARTTGICGSCRFHVASRHRLKSRLERVRRGSTSARDRCGWRAAAPTRGPAKVGSSASTRPPTTCSRRTGFRVDQGS